MLEIIHESGFGAWFSLLFTVAGLAAVLTFGRKRNRVGSTAAAWAAAVLASGALGVGTGQRKVDQFVQNLPENNLQDRVMAVSVGTREAAANLLLSGACALLLLAVSGGFALVGARSGKEPEAMAAARAA